MALAAARRDRRAAAAMVKAARPSMAPMGRAPLQPLAASRPGALLRVQLAFPPQAPRREVLPARRVFRQQAARQEVLPAQPALPRQQVPPAQQALPPQALQQQVVLPVLPRLAASADATANVCTEKKGSSY